MLPDKPTKCECGGKLIRKKVDYVHLGANFGKFDAIVCTKCGDVMFDEKASDQIEKVAKEKGLWGLASKAKVSRIGNSIAVTINKRIADFANLKKGEEVRIYPEDKHRIVIEIV